MPVFFQELPRPRQSTRRHPPAGARAKLALISFAVLGTVAALLLVRPTPANGPTRHTIKLIPVPAAATADRRPTTPDPIPIGSIRPMPVQHPPQQQAPQGAFREIERAAPQDYVGFREIKSGR
ncbi:MAG: hypothetical protein J0I16_00630 [Rhizobiales bacterium]|nr:hypothetical protein [Hyphomicrobiales bacterium]